MTLLTCAHGMPSPASCIDCMDEGVIAPNIHAPECRDSPVIRSNYSAECGKCRNQIHLLDEIVHTTKDRWVHVECVPS